MKQMIAIPLRIDSTQLNKLWHVEASVVRGIAIHPVHEGEPVRHLGYRWTVTHATSGIAFCRIKSLKDARKIRSALLAYPVDLGAMPGCELTRIAPAVCRVIREQFPHLVDASDEALGMRADEVHKIYCVLPRTYSD